MPKKNLILNGWAKSVDHHSESLSVVVEGETPVGNQDHASCCPSGDVCTERLFDLDGERYILELYWLVTQIYNVNGKSSANSMGVIEYELTVIPEIPKYSTLKCFVVRYMRPVLYAAKSETITQRTLCYWPEQCMWIYLCSSIDQAHQPCRNRCYRRGVFVLSFPAWESLQLTCC